MSKRKINEEQNTIQDADEPTIQDGDVAPNIVKFRQAFGDKVIVCVCGAVATTAEETAESGYSHMECVIFTCYSCGTVNRDWAWCESCQIRFGSGHVHKHVLTKKHMRNAARKRMATILVNNATTQSVIRRSESTWGINACSNVSYEGEAGPLNSDNVLSYASGLQDDSGSIADMSTGVFVAAMDAALEVIQSPYPIISMKGNEWLGKSFHDTDRATLTDIVSVFLW